MFIKCKHFTMVISDHGNWEAMYVACQQAQLIHAEEVWHVHVHAAYFLKYSREPIGYNTKISTDGVWKGSFNIWIVLWMRVVWFLYLS